jgi:hypothetical protein
MRMNRTPGDDSFKLRGVILDHADVGQLCFNNCQVSHIGSLSPGSRVTYSIAAAQFRLVAE